jgi:APA family basic amino acid/polyamine antiporter
VSDRRILTLVPASAAVVANMIGTGIFTTTGLMAGMGAGSGDILLAWLMGGFIALCGALCYGEIGASLPRSGGEYYYLSRLLHPSLGFVSGSISLVVGFAAPIAAVAIALNLYLARVVDGWPVRWMAAVMIVALSLLHAYDLRLGSRFQTTITLVQILLIGAFVGGVTLTSPAVHHDRLLQLSPNFLLSSPFAVILVFVSFAYSGWNTAAYIGAELKTPERTLPRSLLIGTATVTALYVFMNVAYLMVVPVGDLAGVREVGYLVAARLWGSGAANTISLVIALTLLCPLSAMVMIGPRIAEAMARDGFFPQGLARLNRRKVPSRAVVLQAVLAVTISAASSFEALLLYIGFVLNVFAMLTVLGLFRLRWERRTRSKICVGYPIPPLLFLGFTLWMTIWSIQTQPMATMVGLATLGLAYILYFVRKKRAHLALDAEG